MHNMMMTYDGNQERYAKIAGHGFRILAEAMGKDLSYEIKCPAVLICGEKDHAGSFIRYNKSWHKNTGIPVRILEDWEAGRRTPPEYIPRLIANQLNMKNLWEGKMIMPGKTDEDNIRIVIG